MRPVFDAFNKTVSYEELYLVRIIYRSQTHGSGRLIQHPSTRVTACRPPPVASSAERPNDAVAS